MRLLWVIINHSHTMMRAKKKKKILTLKYKGRSPFLLQLSISD